MAQLLPPREIGSYGYVQNRTVVFVVQRFAFKKYLLFVIYGCHACEMSFPLRRSASWNVLPATVLNSPSLNVLIKV